MVFTTDISVADKKAFFSIWQFQTLRLSDKHHSDRGLLLIETTPDTSQQAFAI